ncbi:hypothetical protein [Burkholderia ubonensis]|uniref:hypothetical protein n=1 Tax=Burkholderia ubonensis TaxID=101571 RepID=UPI00075C7737|nr:hypothetical protein [Burkholderia ubonensis]KVW31762.1 hypothetical protein WK95_02325 [Burkholderia ubonensis]
MKRGPETACNRRRARCPRDIEEPPLPNGSGHPPPFEAPCAERIRRRLGDAGGLAGGMTMHATGRA